ncbi:MAG: glycosyltransferase, partial [Mycobacteriales bacterium]
GDVLVLPSLQEGFGNVLVEAAECGVPSVAASQALGVADAVLPGVTGVLAASGSAAHLADAVEQARRLPPLDPDLVLRWSGGFSPEVAAQVLEKVLDAVRAGSRE